MRTPDDLIPTRLCCGQRHRGVRCPDGRVMCCLCFDLFSPDELATEDGVAVDICRPCHDAEQAALAVKVTDDGDR